MHAAGLAHKDIRPETILLLETDALEIPGAFHAPTLRSLGTAFLVGYESVRKDERTWASALNVPVDWEATLYTHPSHLTSPVPAFTMEHDVYSVGIALLELALEQSLITRNGEASPIFNKDVVEEEPQPSQVSMADRVMKGEGGAS